jgi:nitrite reductase/ring-hydroxylating ferredoxin subunit
MGKHIVAPVSELPPGTVRQVEIEGRAIAVFNADGEFYALRDTCPHRGARLSDGTVVGAVSSARPGVYDYDGDRRLVKCPWHGWEFDLATGRSWCDPVRERVRAYDVQRERGADLQGAAVPGPYVAETIAISVEDEYVVIVV